MRNNHGRDYDNMTHSVARKDQKIRGENRAPHVGPE